MNRILTILIATLGLTSSAYAQEWTDSTQVPHCVEDPANTRDGVLFLWDTANHYGRDVYAVRLSSIRGYRGNDHSCQMWKSFETGVKGDLMWRHLNWIDTLPTDAQNYKGIPLSTTIRAGLAKVRLGFNEFVSEDSAASWLANHPLGTYNEQINLELSRRFGNGYTASIYQAWIEQKPRNQYIKNRLWENIEKVKSGKARPLRQRLAGYRVFLTEGFMQSKDNDRLSALKKLLTSTGVAWDVTHFDTVGPMSAAIDSVDAQLRDLLSRGEKVIVMGGSKGVPTVMAAIARIDQDIASGRFQPAGQIVAFINGSGMIHGSFLVDWAQSIGPARLIAVQKLREQAELMGLNMKDGTSFFDMSSKSLNPLTLQSAKFMPQDIPYFNFVGILSGDGLAADESIHTMQTLATIPYVAEHGANDGYIEYPGTEIPDSWFANVYTVALHGSHVALDDGDFDTFHLTQPADRELVLSSIFHTVVDSLGN